MNLTASTPTPVTDDGVPIDDHGLASVAGGTHDIEWMDIITTTVVRKAVSTMRGTSFNGNVNEENAGV